MVSSFSVLIRSSKAIYRHAAHFGYLFFWLNSFTCLKVGIKSTLDWIERVVSHTSASFTWSQQILPHANKVQIHLTGNYLRRSKKSKRSKRCDRRWGRSGKSKKEVKSGRTFLKCSEIHGKRENTGIRLKVLDKTVEFKNVRKTSEKDMRSLRC